GRRSGADEALAVALARGLTIAAAAEAAGISERTARRRLKDAAFRARVKQLRGEMVERTVGALSDASGKAVRTLSRLLGPSTRAGVRRSAAATILGELVKLKGVLDLEERVAELERRVAGGEGTGPT